MPLKNEFFGVFKTIKVNGQYILAETVERDNTMDVKPITLIQGTPKNRIFDIGGLEEKISIKAPILIGGGASIDGRTLANLQIENALQPEDATLPLLESANFSVTEAGADVSLTLMSDGDPANSTVLEIIDGRKTGTGTPDDLLDPTSGSHDPTRKARFYDFRAQIGKYTLYIKSLSIGIQVTTEKVYFIAGVSTANDADPVPNDGSNFGTQYPWIGVSGISISGKGEAVVLLDDKNSDYDFTDYDFEGGPGDESINLALGQTGVTAQYPGDVISEDNSFKFQVWSVDDTDWKDLFLDSGGDPLFDLSKAIVKSEVLNISTGLITVGFDFTCWVK